MRLLLLRHYTRRRLASTSRSRSCRRTAAAAAATRAACRRPHASAAIMDSPTSASAADVPGRMSRCVAMKTCGRPIGSPASPALIDCSWPGTIPFFALTSGTTSGTTKYIPCSAAMNRSNARAALDILVHHLANRPGSRVLGGKTFMLGGSTDLAELAPGILAGDLSGIAAHQTPWWARPYTFPPRDLAPPRRLGRQGRTAWHRACRDQDIRVISGTPSWLLDFLSPPGMAAVPQAFPRPRTADPWRCQLHGLSGPVRGAAARHAAPNCAKSIRPAKASFAIADRGSGDGMRLADGQRHLLRVRSGRRRRCRRCQPAIGSPMSHRAWITRSPSPPTRACGPISSAISSASSMLHHRACVVTGRLSYFLSAFGEHLTGEDIDAA